MMQMKNIKKQDKYKNYRRSQQFLMKIHEVKSFAKINLALHVTGKLTNLHKIESVVNFIELHDKIFIKKLIVINIIFLS